MNEHILTAIANFYALFTTVAHFDRIPATNRVRKYFKNHLNLTRGAIDIYMETYEDLCDLYELQIKDPRVTIERIAQLSRAYLSKEEQTHVLLRILEFAAQTKESLEACKELIDLSMEIFCINEENAKDYKAFVSGENSSNVAYINIEGTISRLKFLKLTQFNKIIVSLELAKLVSDKEKEEKKLKCKANLNGEKLEDSIYTILPETGLITIEENKTTYNYGDAFNALGGSKRFDAIHMHGRNVNFNFPNSKNGLHNFTFDIRSGEFIAIMGGSGVGKSTLLSVLNGSLMPQSGKLKVNGKTLYENIDTLKPYIGFVPQDDLLIASLTVKQNLYYTAKFCFDQLSDEELNQKVDKTLDDLGLSYISNLKVGTPLNKTISGGQRKRLNIALELIREPSILFLDEPTSGLSSADSEKVIRILKELTYKGKLIIVNIHQPSSDIYKMFDRLWILDEGGYPIYDGNPINATVYFKRMDNYADAEKTVCPVCGNINPEIMFKIINEHKLDSSGVETEERKRTPEQLHQLYLDNIKKDYGPRPENLPEHLAQKPNRLKQFWLYLKRNIEGKITDRQFIAIALLEAPLLALVVGMLTHYSGDNGYTVFDNKNLLSYMFMAIIVAIFMGMSINAEEIIKDRALLKREKFLQLSHGAYIASKAVQAAIIAVIQTGLFVLVGNTLLQLHGLSLEWWFIMFSASFLAGLTGLFLSQTLSSIVAIYITIPILLIPQILLCGVVVNFDDINQHSENRNVPFIGEIIPSRWAFEALAVTQFSQNEYTKNFFNDQAAQYEYQVDRMGYLHELTVAINSTILYHDLEKGNWDESLDMIRYETNRLTLKHNFTPFISVDSLTREKFTKQIGENYREWLNNQDKILFKKSRIHSKRIDKRKTVMLNELGSTEKLIKLQEENCNKQLENTLVGTDANHIVKREGNKLVAQIGDVYLSPTSTNGRAPFYSSHKIIGSTSFSTFWFNITVLGLMAIGVITLLYIDLPSRRRQ